MGSTRNAFRSKDGSASRRRRSTPATIDARNDRCPQRSTSASYPQPRSPSPQMKSGARSQGSAERLERSLTTPCAGTTARPGLTGKQANRTQVFLVRRTQSVQTQMTVLRRLDLRLNLMVMTSSPDAFNSACSTDLACDSIPRCHPVSLQQAAGLASNRESQEAHQPTLAGRKPIRKFVKTYPHEPRRVVGGSGRDSSRGHHGAA
jgi:hypothetical protein